MGNIDYNSSMMSQIKQVSVLRILCTGISFMLLTSSSVYAQTAQISISETALAQIKILMDDKKARTVSQKKIDSQILFQIKRSSGNRALRAMTSLRNSVQLSPSGRILVDIKANVTPGVIKSIQNNTGTVINSHPNYNSIRAEIPITKIEELSKHNDIHFVRPADQAMTHKINTSEGDVAHGTLIKRANLSINGSGIKTCVMSDAVDSLAALQASGDLPPVVTVLPGQAGSGGSEGTAMLEIVHDLTPGSSLFFATAFGGQAQFAQNILDLRSAYACDVIVDDVFYFAEPPFQDGIIAQAVNSVIADGALFFSSAGNSGNFNDGTSGTWEGDYSPTTAPAAVPGVMSVHNFSGNNYNTITVDSPFGFALYWADPLDGSSNDYDLFLLDPTGTVVLASSTNIQNGNDDPYEFISSDGFNDTNNRLVVALASGSNRFIHLATFRGQLAYTTNGETKGHSAAQDAYSVAAVNVASASGGIFVGGSSNPVEPFSSDGPRRVFFQADGTPYTPGNFSSSGGMVRQKPDITAADGVSTATPGFGTFFGTSAAAPHAAAIAALMLDADGNLTNNQINDLFSMHALDIESAGIDQDSGVGIITADVIPPPVVVSDSDDCTFFVLGSKTHGSTIICL